MADWISRNDEKFFKLCEKWILMLKSETLRTRYKWDDDDCTAVLHDIAISTGAFITYKDNNSTKNRIAKDDAKKIATKSIRAFAASSVRYNQRMDDAARFELGISPRDTVPTTHLRPVSQPRVIVENTVNYFEHRLRAESNETGTTVRPADAFGVRFVWQVGGERPLSGNDILRGRFTRRTVMIVSYSEAESGLPVYYAACYENARGETGPWSPVVEAHIR